MTEKCKHNLPIGQCALYLTDPDIKNKTERDRVMENDDNIMTKKCRKCREEKSLDEFPKHPQCKDGYQNICKDCRSKQSKERYKNRNVKAEEKKNLEPNPPEEKVKPELESARAWIVGKEELNKKILFIEMDKHQDLMDRLIKTAEEEMRTPELQALFYIKIGLANQQGVLD